MAEGVAKAGGWGGDLSPWCPGSLATGPGWKKASLNGVSVETGKANTSAWAVLACWGGGQDGAGDWARLNLAPSTLPWFPRAHGFLDPQPTVSRKGVGLGTEDKPSRRQLRPNLSLPPCPTPSQCPSCPADARKICAQEGRAST